MGNIEKGMLARSKAGHDKGQLYLITDIDPVYVYLADGKTRRLSKPKKKKQKHIRLIRKQYDTEGLDDAAVKRIIKEYDKGMEGE